MKRVDFFESVSGIQYPEMIVNFFDHFIALKAIVEDSGAVSVIDSTENSIEFTILFKDKETQMTAYNAILSLNGVIVIYGRPLSIDTQIYNDQPCIRIKLS